MSFSEDFQQHHTALMRMADAGVSIASASVALGITRSRCYAILRACGQGSGTTRTVITDRHREQVVAVFTESASVNRAAITVGISHGAARRILVAAGLVPATPTPADKTEARDRFLELIAAGWSAARAARQVGVHPRTGRDWRAGIRKTRNTRIHPDGLVVDYTTGTRYTTAMPARADTVTSDRHLSLDDRLAIADGLVNQHTRTRIARGIGRDKSTVSREIRAHSVEGIYLPHQAHRDATAARARPKTSKLVTDTRLREHVEAGLERRLSPEQICHRLVLDFPDDESMRVSHETIYQALYFQARGGLKREVAAALRTGRTRRTPRRQPGERSTGSSTR